jgi:hypothetical protein
MHAATLCTLMQAAPPKQRPCSSPTLCRCMCCIPKYTRNVPPLRYVIVWWVCICPRYNHRMGGSTLVPLCDACCQQTSEEIQDAYPRTVRQHVRAFSCQS